MILKKLTILVFILAFINCENKKTKFKHTNNIVLDDEIRSNLIFKKWLKDTIQDSRNFNSDMFKQKIIINKDSTLVTFTKYYNVNVKIDSIDLLSQKDLKVHEILSVLESEGTLPKSNFNFNFICIDYFFPPLVTYKKGFRFESDHEFEDIIITDKNFIYKYKIMKFKLIDSERLPKQPYKKKSAFRNIPQDNP
jgi:hypothetical protein